MSVRQEITRQSAQNYFLIHASLLDFLNSWTKNLYNVLFKIFLLVRIEFVKETDFLTFRSIFNRPGVDGALLQTSIKYLKKWLPKTVFRCLIRFEVWSSVAKKHLYLRCQQSKIQQKSCKASFICNVKTFELLFYFEIFIGLEYFVPLTLYFYTVIGQN